MAAVTLIPTLAMLADSVELRPATHDRLPLAHSCWPRSIPEAWGRPDKFSLPGPSGTSYAYRARPT